MVGEISPASRLTMPRVAMTATTRGGAPSVNSLALSDDGKGDHASWYEWYYYDAVDLLFVHVDKVTEDRPVDVPIADPRSEFTTTLEPFSKTQK